jgi:hypothetical protein
MKNSLNLKYGLGANTAVPYIIARSGIFSSQIYRGPIKRPEATAPLDIKTLGNAKIIQIAGHRLDQGDADVFYEVVRALFTRAHAHEPGLQVVLECRALLSSIGRASGGKTNVLLRESLERLVNAKFEIYEKTGQFYTTGLLQSVAYPEAGSSKAHVQIEVDPGLIKLYKGNQWALLKKKERSVLKSPTARALYAYYCTHDSNPYHLLPDTLKQLVGRLGMQDYKWLALLRTALNEIKIATGWQVCELAAGSGGRARRVIVIKRMDEKNSHQKNYSGPALETRPGAYDI